MDNTVSDARLVPALFLDRDGVINEDFGFVHRAEDFVRSLEGLALGEVIYTDIARDGALTGPNLEAVRIMQAASPFPLVASGGVRHLEDLRQLKALGVYATIVGKALYTGDLELTDALKLEV